MCRFYYVYIISNYARTVLYTGVTNNIQTRTWQHKNGQGGKFTRKYKCSFLLFFEEYLSVWDAISREKNIKNWKREWKMNLVRQGNPDMIDLAAEWFD